MFANGCNEVNLKISHKGVFLAYLGEKISLIACLHVCLYFTTFHSKGTKHRKREKNKPRWGGGYTTAMEEESSCSSPSSLWDVIVKCDDICFTHILPRLNGTDLKFLYGVNGETRALVKRSSRKRELKKKYKVSEMSSISTLELAWKKPLSPSSWWYEPYFCWGVAQTNKLELLKWAREEKKCKWDEETICVAAGQGNPEMVKYCVANKCPMYEEGACACAAINDHLECLKYLHEEVKAPWDSTIAAWAAQNGHLHILEYLVERKFDKFNTDACEYAAMVGHLDCLKYLHETAKAPWNSDAVREAYENDHPDCVHYLLDNNCPLPEGWSYEDGELHVVESESESESE